MRQEAEVDDGGSGEAAAELSDDKKPAMGNGDDDKDLKHEYLKSYSAALLEQQKLAEKLNQQESAGESTSDIHLATRSSDRQVGMKCKHEEEDEEDVEWEEKTPVAANGNYKVELNVETEEAEEARIGKWINVDHRIIVSNLLRISSSTQQWSGTPQPATNR